MIKAYTEENYELIEKWALAVNQCPPPPFILTRGCFYVEDNRPCVCAFLFLDRDNPLAVISFVYFNPDATAKQKSKGLREVYEALEYLAKGEGNFLLMTDTAYSSIAKVLEKKEYMPFLQGASHLMKLLPINVKEV